MTGLFRTLHFARTLNPAASNMSDLLTILHLGRTVEHMSVCPHGGIKVSFRSNGRNLNFISIRGYVSDA